MQRNKFGEPQPKGHPEIVEALEEIGFDADEVNADISNSPEDEPPFRGWTAEVRENVDGEASFTTLGYDTKEELVKDLRAAGITDLHEI